MLKDWRQKSRHLLKLLLMKISSHYLSGWKLRSPSAENPTRERARARREKPVDVEREFCIYWRKVRYMKSYFLQLISIYWRKQEGKVTTHNSLLTGAGTQSHEEISSLSLGEITREETNLSGQIN